MGNRNDSAQNAFVTRALGVDYRQDVISERTREALQRDGHAEPERTRPANKRSGLSPQRKRAARGRARAAKVANQRRLALATAAN